MKQLIHKYNHQETLLMVSLYPKKGELYSAGTSGVASYAKNVVKNMERRVVVLADVLDKPDIYEEDNVLVYRCFKRNSLLMWLQIVKAIYQFSSVKNILVQLDFAMYGSVVTTSLVIPFLAFLKIFEYRTNVIMHHVVTDIFKLKGHVGLGEGFLDIIKGFIFNKLFHAFYLLLSIFTIKIIVLEDVLRERLGRIISKEKIVTIPHGVDTDIKEIEKFEARKRLGIPRDDCFVLFFGYVNWFKGADFFVEAFKDVHKILGKKAHFIIAGGKSPTLKDRGFYQKYFGRVLENIYDSHNIQITGYVPQDEIGVYFSATDLVVLPYRNFMTASGVFSLVFSYNKPFIVSGELGEMFDESDFKQVFGAVGLRKENIVFDLTQKSCLAVTEEVLKDGLKSKMKNATQIIRRDRSYRNIAILFEILIIAPNVTFQKRLQLSYTR